MICVGRVALAAVVALGRGDLEGALPAEGSPSKGAWTGLVVDRADFVGTAEGWYPPVPPLPPPPETVAAIVAGAAATAGFFGAAMAFAPTGDEGGEALLDPLGREVRSPKKYPAYPPPFPSANAADPPPPLLSLADPPKGFF